ncbi:VOC family protein [Massilia sp. BJB1822]|uniref:VOC family protein n=1 Tax=Massilia sp. BJB1822 TaxID=2744470 RepID=UPI001592AF84|nr:VOC family protein [Massilia sp. BJB1822]NVE01260.1 VOC family protein [Massilia sp. BJB1822]
MSGATSLFGHMRLGYTLVASHKLAEWYRFALDGLGLHVDVLSDDVVALRMDQRQRRIIIQRGDDEDVTALGWELDNADMLELALARLRARGITPHRCDDERAALRGVKSFWSFVGPKGLDIELFIQPELSAAPLNMLASGFVTGDAGMGHVAITTREPEAMQAFWLQVFDARISDRIEDRIGGVDLEFAFMRLNQRHHSVATAATRGLRMNPLRTQIHHLNLQAASLNDVTEGYVRCRRLGYAIASSVGQHPNDRELSFYVETPSGFEIELGWNPLEVHDEAAWHEGYYRGISLWGHFPESLTTSKRITQVGRAISSLTRREHVMGAK